MNSVILRRSGANILLLICLSYTHHALAQNIQLQSSIPLSDTNCDFRNFSFPCNVDGTRTAVLVSSTREPTDILVPGIPTALDRQIDTYQVDFDGNLQVDGRSVSVAPGGFPPFSLDATDYFDPGQAVVNLQTSYTGEFSRLLPRSAPGLTPLENPPFFSNYRDFTNTVRSIDVDARGSLSIGESRYEYNIRSVDPAGLINGTSVALTGSFNGRTDAGALRFGRITGTADLVSGNILTPFPEGTIGPDLAVKSPFGLQYNLTTEITTRLNENGLVTPTVTVTDGINMRGSAITGLADGVAPRDAVNVRQLSAESRARTQAINNEARERQAADTALASSITAEAQTRAAADVVLADAITAEAQTRASADVVLAEAITEESMTRAQVDMQLSQRIDVGNATSAALATSLANETAARLAADSALSTRLDAFGGRLDGIDSRLDRLDDKVSSSAAVAVALTGNTFLPDTKFNLTANVSTYDGAQAGAMQIGALVSRNVAVNVGVATGFNKGGKTAARAGFTIGW